MGVLDEHKLRTKAPGAADGGAGSAPAADIGSTASSGIGVITSPELNADPDNVPGTTGL
jgi:hypothetical protein